MDAAQYPNVIQTEIEGDEHSDRCPLSQETAVMKPYLVDHLVRLSVQMGIVQRMQKLIEVCRSPYAVHNPKHRFVKLRPNQSFFWFDVGVLELDHPTVRRLDVSNMQLAVFIARRDLLPILGEVVFPVSMPLGFILPPMVAMSLASMSPVPNSTSTAPRDQIRTATGTVALGLGCRLDPPFTASRKPHTISMCDSGI